MADVLPDKYGNSLSNAWLSRNGRPTDRMNPVELLSFIGKRRMAALEFEHIVSKTNNGATKIELDNLTNIAQEILSGRQDFNTNLSGDEAKALSDILPPFLVLSADIVQLPYQQHFGTVQLFTFFKIVLSAGETPGLKVCGRYENFHAGAGVFTCAPTIITSLIISCIG